MRLLHMAAVSVLLFAASTGTADGSRRPSQPEANRPAQFPIPISRGSVTYKSAKRIRGVFDGGLKTFGRGVVCNSRREGVDADAVFLLEDKAVLRNAIIGADQNEGVHCLGSCAIENVWWTAVCEDALTMKGDGDGRVLGGGARGARDKVIQHDGRGTVTIVGFTVVDFGKLYRACGNCPVSGKRIVFVKNVRAFHGELLVGVNTNRGDVATIDGTCATGVREICAEFLEAPPGGKSQKLRSGRSRACRYQTVPLC
ncbi:Polysaccharide lyase family 3 [Colletotrichum higginsianum IMI 349063]|uniref:Pectate lyase n=3 Tax=Colletotrichum higginsianum TaxID=80884 RepID=A0A1B7XUD8_COLHI|nr:Polysaccharide lyase family 3 [Colletotrichum higginsianum IMI 349063]OBR03360.1 Polysaccharide lyase family 3 [Colletotrichum higginsianum IMI 349063]TIC89856.1 putative pectate lyase E [Colletotrichum higginsianum]